MREFLGSSALEGSPLVRVESVAGVFPEPPEERCAAADQFEVQRFWRICFRKIRVTEKV